MTTSSLQYYLNKRLPLTNEQEENLIQALTIGCREKTKKAVKSVVKYNLSFFDKKWYSQRILIADREVHYNTGQSYPEEIARIRKDLVKGVR